MPGLGGTLVGCVSAWWRCLGKPLGSWALATNLGWGRADSCALMIASYVSVGKRSTRRKDRRR
jgi:hypothetical protein